MLIEKYFVGRWVRSSITKNLVINIIFCSSEKRYNFSLGDNRDEILELPHTSILKASYRDVTFKFGILSKSWSW